MNQDARLRAIVARIQGEWDHPDLMAFGPLGNTMEDILSIARGETRIATKIMMKKPVCSVCGSDHVLADAYAVWSVDAQEWELSATFDKGSVCENCGGECSLKWIEVKHKP